MLGSLVAITSHPAPPALVASSRSPCHPIGTINNVQSGKRLVGPSTGSATLFRWSGCDMCRKQLYARGDLTVCPTASVPTYSTQHFSAASGARIFLTKENCKSKQQVRPMRGSNSRPSGSKPDALIHCANWSLSKSVKSAFLTVHNCNARASRVLRNVSLPAEHDAARCGDACGWQRAGPYTDS